MKWLLGIVTVVIATLTIFLLNKPAKPDYKISRTGPFYKLSEERGHDSLDSEINVFIVTDSLDKKPISLVLCQGHLTSTDTSTINNITINSSQHDWTELAKQGGVFVIDQSGGIIRTELNIIELLDAISSYNPKVGLISPNFEQECRSKLVSLTKNKQDKSQ